MICPKCNGEKKILIRIPIFIQLILEHFMERTAVIKCPKCKGKGYIDSEDTIEVKNNE